MESININKNLIRQITAHAKEVSPLEACGILAGKGNTAEKLYRMKNIESSTVSYLMDSTEQFRVMKEMEKEGLRMVAIYHSHPEGSPYPSPKDINLAFYPETAYVIIGAKEIKAFMIEEGRVREIEIV